MQTIYLFLHSVTQLLMLLSCNFQVILFHIYVPQIGKTPMFPLEKRLQGKRPHPTATGRVTLYLNTPLSGIIAGNLCWSSGHRKCPVDSQTNHLTESTGHCPKWCHCWIISVRTNNLFVLWFESILYRWLALKQTSFSINLSSINLSIRVEDFGKIKWRLNINVTLGTGLTGKVAVIAGLIPCTTEMTRDYSQLASIERWLYIRGDSKALLQNRMEKYV